MRRALVLVVTVATVAAAVAVVGAPLDAHAGRARIPLLRTSWVLTNRVPVGASLTGVSVDAVFDGKRVGGRSGCNGYSRSYTTKRARMTIANDGVSTQIACEGAAGAVERAYLARLDQVRRYRIVGTTLTLSNHAGRRLLVFQASIGRRALAGGWNATSFFTGNAAQSPAIGSTLTLEFVGNRASGNGGCNTFDGPVKLSGVAGIALGPFRSTVKACADPAASTQEQQYLAALRLVVRYRVTGSRLTLYRKGATIAATFVRATGLTSGS